MDRAHIVVLGRLNSLAVLPQALRQILNSPSP